MIPMRSMLNKEEHCVYKYILVSFSEHSLKKIHLQVEITAHDDFSMKKSNLTIPEKYDYIFQSMSSGTS